MLLTNDWGLQWCSFCSSKPAVGAFTVKDKDFDEPFELPACEECKHSVALEHGFSG